MVTSQWIKSVPNPGEWGSVRDNASYLRRAGQELPVGMPEILDEDFFFKVCNSTHIPGQPHENRVVMRALW